MQRGKKAEFLVARIKYAAYQRFRYINFDLLDKRLPAYQAYDKAGLRNLVHHAVEKVILCRNLFFVLLDIIFDLKTDVIQELLNYYRNKAAGTICILDGCNLTNWTVY